MCIAAGTTEASLLLKFGQRELFMVLGGKKCRLSRTDSPFLCLLIMEIQLLKMLKAL